MIFINFLSIKSKSEHIEKSFTPNRYIDFKDIEDVHEEERIDLFENQFPFLVPT